MITCLFILLIKRIKEEASFSIFDWGWFDIRRYCFQAVINDNLVIFCRDFWFLAFFDCGVDIIFDIIFFTSDLLFTFAKDFLVREIFIHFLNQSITKGMADFFNSLIRPVPWPHDNSNHSLIAMLDGINIELKAPSGLDPVFEPSTPLRP